jgi:hypothetical protein
MFGQLQETRPRTGLVPYTGGVFAPSGSSDAGYAARASSRSGIETTIGRQLRDGYQRQELSSTDMKSIYSQIKELLDYNDEDYVSSVLFPEYFPAARIPTDFPLPTAIFGYKTEHYIGVNSQGNMSFIFRPKVTGPDAAFLNFYQEESWSPADWGTPTTQVTDSISKYYKLCRLTAAVITVTYIGPLDQASGFMVGSLEYNLTRETDGVDTIVSYRNSLVEDGFYLQRTGNIMEGMRLLWFPKDVLDQTFVDPTNHVDNDALILYASGLSALTSVQFRVDVERHFEAIPHSNVRDYIATAPGHPSPGAFGKLKQIPHRFKGLMTVKPQKARETAQASSSPGFWDSVKSMGMNALTSFATSMFSEAIGTGGGMW